METKNKLYKAGIELEKDLEMCRIFHTIEGCADAIILSHGRNAEIIEMRYKNNYSSDMEKTGKTHRGFEYEYIYVYYNGYIWNISPSTYYPFTDYNNPGQINATPYLLIEGSKKIQCGYAQPFNGLELLSVPEKTPLKDVYKQPISWYLYEFIRIYEAEAGDRERDIFNQPHIIFDVLREKDHKIVRCAALDRDAYGVRVFFDVDVVLGRIVG